MVVNRGEGKVRVHINVVPRSTMNTNGGKESTLKDNLKCKLKCFVKPMKDPRGVSPSKGNQGTFSVVQKEFDSHKNEPVGGTHFYTNSFALSLVSTQR